MIQRLDSVEEDLVQLSQLLHACVEAGASIGFIAPFTLKDAETFWLQSVSPGVASGTRKLFVARTNDSVVGTVQLLTAMPANQPHRAEVAKLMVHPTARNQGIAKALMAVVEQEARREGRTLLVLDTQTGSTAEPLYQSLGYQFVGVIPGYARNVHDPQRHSTSIYYKNL